MNPFEQFLFFLSAEMERPVSYGWFHLTFMGIVLAAAVFLCLKFRDATPKQEKIILLSVWGVIAVLEVYKQLQFSVNFTDPVSWDYQWYAFPFQFCSTPLYLLPFAALVRREKLRDGIRMFLACFSLFAGLAVFVYPNDVFVQTIGINIQTMVHHGSQVAVGIWLGVRLLRERRYTLHGFFRACGVFFTTAAIALTLNLCAPLFTDETFNMFYIGPRFPCTLVILDGIYASVPYPVFLALYLLGFCLAAGLIFGIFRGIAALSGTRSAPRPKQANPSR